MLVKASRKQRKLMLETMGFKSMRHFQIETKSQPGTALRMAMWLETIRGVRSARFARGAATAGVILPLLTLRWWTWAFLGWWHRRVLRQANAIVQREKPAGCDFTVGFEP